MDEGKRMSQRVIIRFETMADLCVEAFEHAMKLLDPGDNPVQLLCSVDLRSVAEHLEAESGLSLNVVYVPDQLLVSRSAWAVLCPGKAVVVPMSD